MFDKWDSVLARILREIDLTDIQLIGCYRRGRSSGNENPVTVLVIADVNSKKSWRTTRDLIAGILKDSNLPMVAVEIVRDSKMTSSSPREGFKEELLKGKAIAGDPIAHSRNDVGSWTLGGFIELQHPSTLKWSCFALTCFQVIDPLDRDLEDQELAAVQKWRSHGLSLLDAKSSGAEASLARRCLQTSHPSPRAKKEQIDGHQSEIKSMKIYQDFLHGLGTKEHGLFDTELTESREKSWERQHSNIVNEEERIDDIQRFFQNSDNILGHVRFASGFRSRAFRALDGESYPTTLDWALIEVDAAKRTLSNKVSNIP